MVIHFIGIDIAKHKFDVALILNDKFKSKAFKNNAQGYDDLMQWLRRWNINRVHACMEATGAYWEGLAHFLDDLGQTVSVVNPVKIAAFAKSELTRNKTDKGDARLIARFCKEKQPHSWVAPSCEIRKLQALVRRLDALINMQTMEKNRLEVAQDVVVLSIKEHLIYLEKEIDKTQQQIKNHIDQNPNLKQQADLLTSIPGIADKTAAIILAEIQCIANYSKAKQLVAYTGVNPKHYESGTSVRKKERLSKIGNARLRKALFFPAMVAKRYNPLIVEFAQRLENNGKDKMTIIGAIMRKLIHIVFGILKSGQPFNPHYGENCG